MTVELLKEIIEYLPPEMEILIKLDDGSMIDLCHKNEVVCDLDAYLQDEHRNIQGYFLVLQICTCTTENMPVNSININPQNN